MSFKERWWKMVTVLQKSSTRELSWSTGQNHCCANTDVHENRVAQMVDTRTVTDNSLPSIAFHRSNVNRGTSNVFLQFFFIYIYERKKERNTKRKEIDESRSEIVRCVRLSKISWRKENLFFGKKKKWNFSRHSMSRVYFARVKFSILFSLIPISRVSVE